MTVVEAIERPTVPGARYASPMTVIESQERPELNWSQAHRRRLRALWRSAGWPCQDLIEAELLAAGCLMRIPDGPQGRERLRLTEEGVRVLAASVQANRSQLAEHEALVTRVAVEMHRSGRLVWRGLSLRSPLPTPDEPERRRWVVAKPDVYSLRPSSLARGLQPVVHEIKVRRADLLSDLRRADKRAAYVGMSSQTWYVLKAGIGEPDEIPPDCGVILAHPVEAPHSAGVAAGQPVDKGRRDGTLAGLRHARLELIRSAPQRASEPDLATWLALAKAHRETDLEEEPQASF
jgi:hypothetical protein